MNTPIKKKVDPIKRMFSIIIGVLVFSLMVQTCSNSKQNKRITQLETQLHTSDSINIINFKNIKNNSITTQDLKIEGLKSELRAIEATDRRKIDMDRQGEIRVEIERLEKQK